jgi:hypothetical protein
VATTTIVGTPAGTVVSTITGQPLADLLFLAASASSPAGPTTGAAGPFDVAAAVGTPIGTAAGVAGSWATTVVASTPTCPSYAHPWVEPHTGRRHMPTWFSGAACLAVLL